jgi:sigma-54 dependent transcriptional regulator
MPLDYPLIEEDPLSAVEELITVTTSLSTERDLHRLLKMIIHSACKLTGAEGGRIYLLDRLKRDLFLEVALNGGTVVAVANFSPVPLFVDEMPVTSHVCGYCAFLGKIANIPDVYHYSGFDCRDIYEYDRRFGYHTQSLLAAPLRNHQGVTVGVLQLSNLRHSQKGRIVPFPKPLESLVAAFASQAAVAVDNVQLIQENRRLVGILDRTNQRLERENLELRNRIRATAQGQFPDIVGESPAMRQVFDLMGKVVNTDATVLLRGETGTGKELIAAAIHRNSRRAAGELVVQNCAAVPEGLLEAELFGYCKGAFTGATLNKKGLFEVAEGGTLFLDEIGDMPIGIQAKLLRVLQEKEVRPLGSLQSRRVNVRVIAATHCHLEQKIREGAFREDLYYRLCVFPIQLPPLRERKEDLPALLDYYLKRFTKRYEKQLSGFSPAALEALLQYDYPGNIRELRNILERAVLLSETGGSLLPAHLPPPVLERQSLENSVASLLDEAGDLRELVRRFEALTIEKSLRAHRGNQTETAKALNIPRRTLIDKMHKYNLLRQRYLLFREE